jgi:hypothetical protein
MLSSIVRLDELRSNDPLNQIIEILRSRDAIIYVGLRSVHIIPTIFVPVSHRG